MRKRKSYISVWCLLLSRYKRFHGGKFACNVGIPWNSNFGRDTISHTKGQKGEYLCFSLMFLMATCPMMVVSLIHSCSIEYRSLGTVCQQNGSIISEPNKGQLQCPMLRYGFLLESLSYMHWYMWKK